MWVVADGILGFTDIVALHFLEVLDFSWEGRGKEGFCCCCRVRGSKVRGRVGDGRGEMVEWEKSAEVTELGGMDGGDKQVEDGVSDCMFPNVRKTFWRSASWNAFPGRKSVGEQVPLSTMMTYGDSNVFPSSDAFVAASNGKGLQLPLTPRGQQGTKSRAALPTLQPLAITRKSVDDWSRAADDGGEWTPPVTPNRKKDGNRLRNGLEIKLDIGAVQRARDASEPTETQLKRDKFAFFDKECSRVAEHIYLGSDAVAKNRETLRANGITHVLNCVGFVCPEYFPKELSYKTLWLQDNPCEDITSILYDVFDYFEEVRELGGRVFVHCCQGVSRSTSLVIAYLMWREGRSFEDAFQDVKAARGVTNPNMGFACQLLQCQKRVHAAPVSPNSMLRMYRMAPHSPHDPLHLVPKAVNSPGVAALDSRGAFVVHIPSALFVWQGRLCPPDMASAAETAAHQVVHYERAQGPIVRVSEGSEPLEFWEALNKGPLKHSADGDGLATRDSFKPEQDAQGLDHKHSVLRNVSSYNLDFEVFQRAKEGGVPQAPYPGPKPLIPPRDSGWSRLRRKFFSSSGFRGKDKVQPEESPKVEARALEPAASLDRQRQSKGVVDSHVLPVASPDNSLSSSPSPFSSESLSSSSSISSSPPFLSRSPSLHGSPPISHMILRSASPASSHAWSPPPSQSLQPASSDNFSDSKPSSPPHGGLKVPLAQRRGSLPLKLPAISCDPPPAPRGVSRKPRLPPITASNISKVVDPAGNENGDTRDNFRATVADREDHTRSKDGFELDEPISSTSNEEWTECMSRCATPPPSSPQGLGLLNSSSTGGAGQYLWQSSSGQKHSSKGSSLPSLYEWPRLEKIDMFDADDLDSKAAFVLVAPGSRHLDNPDQSPGSLFVWAGRDWTTPGGTGVQEGIVLPELEQIGINFIKEMRLQTDLPVRVVQEGQEPEDFWNQFVNG